MSLNGKKIQIISVSKSDGFGICCLNPWNIQDRELQGFTGGKKTLQVVAATSASHFPFVNHKLLFIVSCRWDASSPKKRKEVCQA